MNVATLTSRAAKVAISALALAVIGGCGVHGPAAPGHAAHQHASAAHRAAQGPGVALGNQAGAAASQPAAHTAAPKVPAVSAPAATQAPTPVPLTACPALGQTSTDAGGNPVQCAGSGAAPMWYCNPLYPYPGDFPPMPGQPAPLGGYPHVVLATDGTTYVADTQTSPDVWVWQVTVPPC